MPVTAVRLSKVIYSDRPNNTSAATVHWQIDTSTPDDGTKKIIEEAQALGTNPLPEPGDTYNVDGDTNNSLFLMDIRVEKVNQEQTDRKKALLWAVGTYETVIGQITPGTVPTQQPIRPWIEFEQETVPIEKAQVLITLGNTLQADKSIAAGAYTGIVNAAGQPFDQTFYKNRTNIIYNQRQWVLDLDGLIAFHKKYENTTNEQTYRGYPPDYAKYLNLGSVQPQVIDGVTYYEATLRVALSGNEIDEDQPTTDPPQRWGGFIKTVRNYGWKHYYKDPDDGNNYKLVNAKPEPTDDPLAKPTDTKKFKLDATEPVNLSLYGERLDDPNRDDDGADGGGPIEPVSYKTRYIGYRILNQENYTQMEADFNALKVIP